VTTKQVRIGVAVGLSVVLAATAALAGRGPHREGQRPGGAVRAALEKLDLTQAQKDRLRELVLEARPGLQALRGQRQADRAALHAALEAPTPDPSTIGSLMVKMKQGREMVRAERQRLHDATLSVLTPEQRVRFEAYLDAFKALRRRGGDTR
jgi:Spy/CpxP family protein refolding chaperone